MEDPIDESIDIELDQEQRMMVDQLKQIMEDGRTTEEIMLKKVDRKTLRSKPEKANGVLQFGKTEGVWVAGKLWLKKFRVHERSVGTTELHYSTKKRLAVLLFLCCSSRCSRVYVVLF